MKIKGFTPIFDSLAKKYDPYTALVYGKIWRICDWSELGVCTMSNEKIAEQLGLSEKTIRRKKETLAEDGLIRVVGSTGSTDTVTTCHDVVMRMELDYTPDSGDESVDFQSRTPDGESYKDSNKIEDKILRNVIAIEEGQKLSSAIQDDFRKWLGLTPNWDTKTNQANYQFFRERYQAGETAQQFKEWWVAEDWRGVEGQMPSFNNVREMWGQAFLEKKNPLAMSAIERGANKVY